MRCRSNVSKHRDRGKISILILALDTCALRVKTQWPMKRLILAIIFMFKCDFFQFDDSQFRQVEGGAMGNPFACSWVVPTFP